VLFTFCVSKLTTYRYFCVENLHDAAYFTKTRSEYSLSSIIQLRDERNGNDATPRETSSENVNVHMNLQDDQIKTHINH
jgi:hypothetical protein